jgi:hypothetical protein
MRGLKGIALVVGIGVVVVDGPAMGSAQDDLAEFQLAMNAYDAGEYETAETRFRALLDRDPPLDNKALIFEVHKYLGATLMYLGKKKKAEKQFEALLRADPDFELDPVLFPTDILDTFYQVKLRIADELASIQKKKEEDAAKAKAEKEAMKKKLIEAIRQASEPVYLGREKRPKSLFFSFVPFGVGQFQNGQMLKGWLFLGGELALLGANITLWGLSEHFIRESNRKLRADLPGWTADRTTAKNFKLATNIVAGVVIAAMVAGIIDAIAYYYKLGDSAAAWKPIDADEVPPELRKQPPDILEEDIDVLIGFSWKWTF